MLLTKNCAILYLALLCYTLQDLRFRYLPAKIQKIPILCKNIGKYFVLSLSQPIGIFSF